MMDVLEWSAHPFLLAGAWVAIEITALAMIGALVLGLVLAAMRLSALAVLRGAAWTYIWFIRGTPLLLQLIFIYDVLPMIGINLDNFTTAVIGFALHDSAFCAEYIRAAILSVHRNQRIAATAYGMGPLLTLRRIVLPQAMRVIVPQTANTAINMLKSTSVASVIFVNELSFRAHQVAAQNFKYFTVLTAAGLIYLFMTSLLSVVQDWLERYYNVELERYSMLSGLWGHMTRRKGTAGLGPPDPQVLIAARPVRAANLHTGLIDRFVANAADTVAKDPFVVCYNVRKSYGSNNVLRGIDLTVGRGEVVAILGPSGSGKSTLLRMINHLESLDRGEVKVAGKYIGYRRVGATLKPVRNIARARAEARIGMVFQQFNLWDHLTAIENVMEAPIQVYGEKPAQAREVALQLMSSIGLANQADRLPHHLSGGQQQRVAIARALAISPNLMLFDEPTSALDPELVGEVLTVIRRLAEAGMTMIVVTHEVPFAREVADRVVFMDDGQIVEQGPAAQVIDNPAHERTRRFLRQVGHTPPAMTVT
jgi:polar amino acid transport system permease protein